MEELVPEILNAPVWVQGALALAVAFVLYSLIAPGVRHRRYASQFADVARTFGHDRAAGAEGSFTTDVGGRVFEVRHQHRSGAGSVGTMRGPRGHLLVTATRLAPPRWEMHGVDIEQGNVRLKRALGHAAVTSGDEAFDVRFLVKEDGIPVRENWLDAETRRAIARFYEQPVARGTVWIQEGQLSHLLPTPWTGLDEQALRALLNEQASLASALERTAGWRV